ncbi:ABC transporter permease [Longibacter salinarum]|nr:ABC transporter permease [Longibacter salinarum]
MLMRSPMYASINLGGLGAGLACCLLAIAFVQHERQWEQHHDDAERIYRVISERGGELWSSVSFSRSAHDDPVAQLALPHQLEASIPEVERAAQFTILRGEEALDYIETPDGRRHVSPPRLVTNTGAAFADLFSFEKVSGAPLSQALEKPGSAVLTRPTAERYFADADPIGQTLTVHRGGGETSAFTVRSVIEEPPDDSRIQFGIATRVSVIDHSAAFQYVLLQKGAAPDALDEAIESAMTTVNPSLTEPDSDWEGARLQALTDVYLSAPTLYDRGPNRDIRSLWIFVGIAVLVLMITVINYANLGLALHAGRTQEIGARKAVGADDWQIATTFLAETLILAVASVPLAMALATVGLPVLNHVMATDISGAWLVEPTIISALAGVAALAGLVAGSYPTIVLSRKGVTDLLRPSMRPSGLAGRGWSMRHTLIALQFGTLILLGSVSLVAYQHLQSMETDELGYDPGGVVEVTSIQNDRQAYQRFRRLALQSSTVKAVGMGSAVPNDIEGHIAFAITSEDGDRRTFEAGASHAVDVHWCQAMGIEHSVVDSMIAQGDDAPVRWLINETASDLVKGDPVGATWSFQPEDPSATGFQIDGVIPDLHLVSKRHAIPPAVYRVFSNPPWAGNAVVRFRTSQTKDGMEHLREIWSSIRPDTPFAATFLTQQHEQFYAQERRFTLLAAGIGGLALLLAVVGLANLVGQLTQQRKREIGIRKALGASKTSILALLNREYLGIIAAAFLLGAPIAWVAVHRWLQSYAVATEIPVWPFVVTGTVAFLVAVATVTAHGMRAASVDPSAVLRAE